MLLGGDDHSLCLHWLITNCGDVAAAYLFFFSKQLAEPFPSRSQKKNVIFFVSDGMGPASLSLTRSFRQLQDDLPIDDILNLDKHFIGHSRTRSTDSLVTDSAAGATAFSCGLKSYNGAISVLPDGTACGSVLEAAKLDGYLTGMVVTTRVTDATPACFASHTDFRDEEDLIAHHQLGNTPLGRTVDLLIGGGRCHYLPSGGHYEGCRKDNRNLVNEAKEEGWDYISNIEGYRTLNGGKNVSLPLLALLANYDIPFDLDRNDEVHPSLEDTTRTALTALSAGSKDSDKGFFLMVEGSRIDHAGHLNDPAAQVREVLAFDAAFKAAIDFAKEQQEKYGIETVIVSTSDHETGGLSTARQLSPDYPEYLWHPEALLSAQHSAEYLGWAIKNYKGPNVEKFIRHDIVKKGLGITDDNDLSEITQRLLKKDTDPSAAEYNAQVMQTEIANIISERAQIGWATHGHSAVDVNVYGYGSNPGLQYYMYKRIGGSNENTDIGKFLQEYLSVDIKHVTSKLQGMKTAEDYEEPMDAYHANLQPQQ